VSNLSVLNSIYLSLCVISVNIGRAEMFHDDDEVGTTELIIITIIIQHT